MANNNTIYIFIIIAISITDGVILNRRGNKILTRKGNLYRQVLKQPIDLRSILAPGDRYPASWCIMSRDVSPRSWSRAISSSSSGVVSILRRDTLPSSVNENRSHDVNYNE